MKEISFKTAKLAHEKGCDVVSPKVYCNVTENLFGSEYSYGDDYFAPEQEELKKYLRERQTPIIVTPETDFVAWSCNIDHPDKGRKHIDKVDGKLINSYEDALEAGLNYALGLI